MNKIAWFVLLALLIWSCSGSKVISFTGQKVNFQNYYTYRVEHPRYPEDTSSVQDRAALLKNKIEESISIQLNSRGYSNTQPADLVVTYNLILDKKVDYDVNNSYSRSRYNNYPGNYNYYDPYNPYNPYRFNKKVYTEGTLIVEIREDFGNALVWAGSLDLKYNKSKSKKGDPVQNAFDIIFNEYNHIAGSANITGVENSK